MAAKLILTEGGTKKAFKLTGGSVRIGSGAGCPVRLSDAAVSEEHCLLAKTDAGWELTDLKSAQGTRVNGSFVDHKVLASGDVITIGGATIDVEIEEEIVEQVIIGEPASPTPAPPAPAAAAAVPSPADAGQPVGSMPMSRKSAAGAASKRSSGRGKARVAAARRQRDDDWDDDDRGDRRGRKQGLSTPAIVGIVVSAVSILGLVLFLSLKTLESDPEANLFNQVLSARNDGNAELAIKLGNQFLKEFPDSTSRGKIEEYIEEFESGVDPNKSQAIIYRFNSWFNSLKQQFDGEAYQQEYANATQLFIIQAEYFLDECPKGHEKFGAVQTMLSRAREQWEHISTEKWAFTPKDRKELNAVDTLMRQMYYKACFAMLDRFMAAGDEVDKRDGKVLEADYTRYQKEDFDKNVIIAENRAEKGELIQALVKLRFLEALFTEEYASRVRPMIAELEQRRKEAAGG
ncbi:MAG: FHA domain-containing protein [Planctomycetota bacterium]